MKWLWYSNNLNSTPRTNVKELRVVLHARKPKGGETEVGRSLELVGQLLDFLVSPRAVRSLVTIKKLGG